VPGLFEAQRVRVITADSRAVVGTVVRLADDTLAIAISDGSFERIPWATVVAVDASRGSRDQTGRYALRGAAVGVAVGLIAMATCDEGSGSFITCADVAPIVVGGSIGIGLLVGAMVGSASRRPERWEQLRIRPALGVVPTSSGARPYLMMSLGAAGGS
jgi:hypothetical protein